MTLDPEWNDAQRDFHRFLVKYGLRLLAVARREVWDFRLPPSNAEDVRSEALVRAWKAWNSRLAELSSNQKYAWVCKAIYNVASEQARAADNSRRARRAPEDVEHLLRQKQLDPYEIVLLREVLSTISRVLTALPDQQRLVFSLARSGISQREIAKLLRVPEGTVRSQVSTVTQKLKASLGPDLLAELGFAPRGKGA